MHAQYFGTIISAHVSRHQRCTATHPQLLRTRYVSTAASPSSPSHKPSSLQSAPKISSQREDPVPISSKQTLGHPHGLRLGVGKMSFCRYSSIISHHTESWPDDAQTRAAWHASSSKLLLLRYDTSYHSQGTALFRSGRCKWLLGISRVRFVLCYLLAGLSARCTVLYLSSAWTNERTNGLALSIYLAQGVKGQVKSLDRPAPYQRRHEVHALRNRRRRGQQSVRAGWTLLQNDEAESVLHSTVPSVTARGRYGTLSVLY